MRSTTIKLLLAATLLGIAAGGVAAKLGHIGAFALDPYVLRLKLVWVCASIAGLVYATMLIGLAATSTRPARFVSSRRMELLWAVIPALILIVLASPAVDMLATLAATAGHEVAAAAP